MDKIDIRRALEVFHQVEKTPETFADQLTILYYISSHSRLWIFAIGGAGVARSPQWSSNVLPRYRGWGASKISDIYTHPPTAPWPDLSSKYPLDLGSLSKAAGWVCCKLLSS